MVRNHAELSAALCDALTQDASDFVDALYGVDGIEDPGVREAVAQMRDATKAMFERSRAKLGGAAVSLVGESIDGDKYKTQVQVEAGPKLEIIVDDVYERGGGLRTRDLVDIILIG